MPDILHRVGIKSSTHEVYKALSEENGLAGWWSKNVKASPTVGAVDQFSFGDRGFNDMKVVELVPGERVKWQCVDGAKEWIGTELTFDLKEERSYRCALCPASLERASRVYALLQHQMGNVAAHPEIAV
jgi:uncharacterized protein YndB with AHSA1/START domain